MVDDPIEQRIRERRVQEQDGEAVADNAPVNTGCGNAADNATAEKRKPSAATLAAITVPAQAAPTRLSTIRWSWWNPVGL
ncbi:putative transcriptional regulators [Bifidobacterium adolescentis]|nr:putative transcriptional regulators [Bifidobacterium adolescentis]